MSNKALVRDCILEAVSKEDCTIADILEHVYEQCSDSVNPIDIVQEVKDLASEMKLEIKKTECGEYIHTLPTNKHWLIKPMSM